MRLKNFLQTVAVSCGTVACSFLFAASAHAAVGDLQAINLYDTNHNGKIDRVDVQIDNTGGHTWQKDGSPQNTYVVKYAGNVVPISTADFDAGGGVANPIIIQLGLDESSVNLPVDTSNASLEVTYAPVTGDQTCTNCFYDMTDHLEAPAIGADDIGNDAEVDWAAPILTSVVPGVNASAGSAQSLVLNFSEPMNPSFVCGFGGVSYGGSEIYLAGTTACSLSGNFELSPDPGGTWTDTWSPGNKTVSLTHSVPLLKGTTYTMKLYPGTIRAADSGTLPLDSGGTLVPLTFDYSYEYSFKFTTSSGGGMPVPSVPYVAPAAPTCTLTAPSAGASLTAGSVYDVAWTSTGDGISNTLLSFSDDGGSTWQIVSSTTSSGTFAWAVPNDATSQAKVKIDCRDGGSVLASSTSDAFSIVAAPITAPVATPVVTVPIVPPPAPAVVVPALYPPGTLLKADVWSAIFSVGTDGARHLFPNPIIYHTWFPDFSGIVTVPLATLGKVPIGKAMMPKPGTLMVKLQSDPKTYWIDPTDAKAHWLTSEAAAARVAGPDWNKKIVDIGVTYWSALTFGSDLN